ncbi:MAG: prepilin-type N-terminal cleavage/methylation domain-containing protein [Magnetococcales bacterium]|nr:prepilin-type N-terminal cleavage/methylation domain-containing protein [Magnetococcales bacterium]
MVVSGNRARAWKGQQGFTLMEILIVVIILSVLAAIVMPQFGSSTEDAKLSSVKNNLTSMRAIVDMYHHQHNNRYPGAYKETDGTTAAATAADAATAFVAQLTQYTDANGKVSGTKDNTYRFGPYLKQFTLPENPFLTGTAATNIVVDLTENDITVAPTADGTTGWKFYLLTGRLTANDNVALSDGTKTTAF